MNHYVPLLVLALIFTVGSAEIFIVRSFSTLPSVSIESNNSPREILSRFIRMKEQSFSTPPIRQPLPTPEENLSNLIDGAEEAASDLGISSPVFSMMRSITNLVLSRSTPPYSTILSPTIRIEHPLPCSPDISRLCGESAMRADPRATFLCLKNNLGELSPSCSSALQSSKLFLCSDSLRKFCTGSLPTSLPQCLIDNAEGLEPLCRSQLVLDGLILDEEQDFESGKQEQGIVDKEEVHVTESSQDEAINDDDDDYTIQDEMDTSLFSTASAAGGSEDGDTRHHSTMSITLWCVLVVGLVSLVVAGLSLIMYNRNRPGTKNSIQERLIHDDDDEQISIPVDESAFEYSSMNDDCLQQEQ